MLAFKNINFRMRILAAILIILSLFLVLRLGYLQIFKFDKFHTLSLKNQMSVIPIESPRGIIVDRNGILLAENIPVYGLEITPERTNNIKITLKNLKILLPSITDDEQKNFYKLKKHSRSYIPIPLKLKLTQKEVALFAVNQYKFPGVSIKAHLMRNYPLKNYTAHSVGYVGRININELRDFNHKQYMATSFVGKSGLEKFYEKLLHGKVGYEQIETDATGRKVRTIFRKNPESGSKLILTLDSRVQIAALNALQGLRGAIVVIDVRNGDIISMVSSPSFNPQLFVSGITNKDYHKLITATARPLYNRAVKGIYAPGSTIKPFMALGGLNYNIIDEKEKIYDPGYLILPSSKHIYHDWKHSGHGLVDLRRSIVVSCDTYFYKLGRKMGINLIHNFLMQFGFGNKTQIDFPGEAQGIVPGKIWKKRFRKTIWYPGDTLITAIGQGFMLSSPLQLASATASLARLGHRFRPHLLEKIQNTDSGKIQIIKHLEEYPVTIKKDYYWKIIVNAMQGVIQDKEGTGFRFGRNSSYSVAAKTGTAQVYSGKKFYNVAYDKIPEHLRDNSLFIAFAPVKSPKVAIAVVIENNSIAPNVARKVMDAYFENN